MSASERTALRALVEMTLELRAADRPDRPVDELVNRLAICAYCMVVRRDAPPTY